MEVIIKLYQYVLDYSLAMSLFHSFCTFKLVLNVIVIFQTFTQFGY